PRASPALRGRKQGASTGCERSSSAQRIEAAARHPPVELAPERLLAQLGGGEQPVEIDAGVDSHRLEQVHQVFGADVAGVAAAVLHFRRMAADPAEGRIEMAHTRLIRRYIVREP